MYFIIQNKKKCQVQLLELNVSESHCSFDIHNAEDFSFLLMLYIINIINWCFITSYDIYNTSYNVINQYNMGIKRTEEVYFLGLCTPVQSVSLNCFMGQDNLSLIITSRKKELYFHAQNLPLWCLGIKVCLPTSLCTPKELPKINRITHKKQVFISKTKTWRPF